MEPSRDDETVADLLSMKSRVEKSIADLSDEKEKVKVRLNQIKDLKAAERKKRTDEHLKMYRLKISLVESKKKMELHQNYMNKILDTIKVIEEGIRNEMRLKNFEKPIMQLNDAIEGAISFYSEESLQMELMKRSNAVRERRVEYTRLESELNDTNRRIEERKREEERARLAELEKARLAEEQAKRIEEERALAEEAKLRERYRQMSVNQSNHSFLGGEVNSASSETNFDTFAKPISRTSSTNISEAQNTDQANETETSSNQATGFAALSFSQFLRW